MCEYDHNINKTDPKDLARIMSVSSADERLWRPEEMGALLQHQLVSPLESELRSVHTNLLKEFQRKTQGADKPPRNCRELFLAKQPDPDVLRITKDFAKLCRQSDTNPVPEQIPTVIYFTSIAMAEVKCSARITSLPNSRIRSGLQWTIAQEWISPELRDLLQEALEQL